MSIGASASAPRLCGLVARNTCSTSKWSPTTEARCASLAAVATLLRPAAGTAKDSTCHLVLVTVMSATLGLLTYKLAPSVPRVAADDDVDKRFGVGDGVGRLHGPVDGRVRSGQDS